MRDRALSSSTGFVQGGTVERLSIAAKADFRRQFAVVAAEGDVLAGFGRRKP